MTYHSGPPGPALQLRAILCCCPELLGHRVTRPHLFGSKLRQRMTQHALAGTDLQHPCPGQELRVEYAHRFGYAQPQKVAFLKEGLLSLPLRSQLLGDNGVIGKLGTSIPRSAR